MALDLFPGSPSGADTLSGVKRGVDSFKEPLPEDSARKPGFGTFYSNCEL